MHRTDAPAFQRMRQAWGTVWGHGPSLGTETVRLLRRKQKMIESDSYMNASEKTPPSTSAWVAGLLLTAAGLAGGIAAYFYFFHTAK